MTIHPAARAISSAPSVERSGNLAKHRAEEAAEQAGKHDRQEHNAESRDEVPRGQALGVNKVLDIIGGRHLAPDAHATASAKSWRWPPTAVRRIPVQTRSSMKDQLVRWMGVGPDAASAARWRGPG